MEAGFLTPNKGNAARLAVVIGLHGAALTAVALSKMDMPIKEVFPPIFVDNYPEPAPPPEVIPEPKAEPKAQAPSEFRAENPLVKLPAQSTVEGKTDPVPTPPLDSRPGTEVVISGGGGAVEPPVPAPVRVEAQIDRRYAGDLQPPYPPSEQRMSNEGKVTVRVTIGTDGRVKAVARVSATSDAFYKATERQALSRWRFKPATVDGRPVESQKVMSVTFRMED